MLVDIYVGLYIWCLFGSMWIIMLGSVKKNSDYENIKLLDPYKKWNLVKYVQI